jgi:hypothetical protein
MEQSRCNNCIVLEKRIAELLTDLLELEDRRSRERSRFISEQQCQFFKRLDQPDESLYVPRRDFEDLLELLKRVVQDARTETLENVKSKVEKFLV